MALGSSSRRSSTPQLNAPGLPPPWSAKLIVFCLDNRLAMFKLARFRLRSHGFHSACCAQHAAVFLKT